MLTFANMYTERDFLLSIVLKPKPSKNEQHRQIQMYCLVPL
jgi:hypothetical protein